MRYRVTILGFLLFSLTALGSEATNIGEVKAYIVREYAETVPQDKINRTELSLAIAGFNSATEFARSSIEGYLKDNGNKTVDTMSVDYFNNNGISNCNIEGVVNDTIPYRISIPDLKSGHVHSVFNVGWDSTRKLIKFDN